MASHTFGQDFTASRNCYAVVYNAAGNVFDFNDNTFKALASATTPFAACTEQTSGGGTGQSTYVVTINLALLNKTLDTVRYGITFFDRAGGTPAPLTDTAWTYRSPFSVQAAEIGDDELAVEFCPCFTSTAGTTMRALVTVLRNGKPVNVYTLDSAATCTVTAREHGAGSDLFTTSAATVSSNGDFAVSQASPGYTSDRAYQHTIAITVNSTTTSFRFPVANFG
jgi:hypothetical protein